MTTALQILMTHRYGTQGGAPAICLGADGLPTDCRWKGRRRGELALLDVMRPVDAFRRGRAHVLHELADILDLEEVKA